MCARAVRCSPCRQLCTGKHCVLGIRCLALIFCFLCGEPLPLDLFLSCAHALQGTSTPPPRAHFLSKSRRAFSKFCETRSRPLPQAQAQHSFEVLLFSGPHLSQCHDCHSRACEYFWITLRRKAQVGSRFLNLCDTADYSVQ